MWYEQMSFVNLCIIIFAYVCRYGKQVFELLYSCIKQVVASYSLIKIIETAH